MTRSVLLFSSTVMLGVIGTVPVVAQPAAAGSGSDNHELKCINLMGDTPIIDNRTILVKMKAGTVRYKRIDLAAPCPDIAWEGFTYTPYSFNELCSSDPLRVRSNAGETCAISNITDISDEEAKQLIARKSRK